MKAALAWGEAVPNYANMPGDLEAAYQDALRKLNISEVARETSRSRRALTMYLSGERAVTEEAARELIEFLRKRGTALLDAADEVEAALSRPKLKGGG